jgi:hypothetical protein
MSAAPFAACTQRRGVTGTMAYGCGRARSPVIGRYTAASTTSAEQVAASPSPTSIGRTNGGPPSGRFSADRCSNPLPCRCARRPHHAGGHPAATIAFKTWYSDGSTNANVADITTATVSPFKRYTFTATRPSDVLENASLVVRPADGGHQATVPTGYGPQLSDPARSAALAAA